MSSRVSSRPSRCSSPFFWRLNATRAGTLTCSETCTPACLSSRASPQTPAWPYSFPPHAHAAPSPSSATACHPPRLTDTNVFPDFTFRGVGIHSSSVSRPRCRARFSPTRTSPPSARAPPSCGSPRRAASRVGPSRLRPSVRRRTRPKAGAGPWAWGRASRGVARFAVTGAEGEAELAVLAAAPLRDGRRDGEGATNKGATREGVVRNEGGQRVAQHGGGTARGSARRLRRRTTKMTSSVGSSISTVFVMMKRRFGATGWSLFRGGENARSADSSKVRIDWPTNCAPLAAKWIKMAIVRATLRGTVARAAP